MAATIVEILFNLLEVAVIFFVASLSASWALLRRFQPRMVVLFGTLGAALFMAGSFYAVESGWGPHFFDQFRAEFDPLWDNDFLPGLKTSLSPENLTPEVVAAVKTFFLKYFWFSIPALITVLSVVTGLVSYYLSSAVLRRITTRVNPPLSFRFWALPEPLVFGFLAGCLLKLFTPENGVWDIVGDNLLVFFIGLYTLEGLSIISFFFHRWRFSPFWRLAVLYLMFQFFTPFLIALATGLSIGDVWSDFRKLKTAMPGEKIS